MEVPLSHYQKYNQAGPRYTSYPAYPHWTKPPTQNQWFTLLQNHANSGNIFDIYIHIPFCESLCTYCGCSRIITKDQDFASRYVDCLIKEWGVYKSLAQNLKLGSLHLGGGTPTFLRYPNLKRLLDNILEGIDPSGFYGAIEIDPRVTNQDQMEYLIEKGFCKFSLGIQDFDPHVQKIINRVQPVSLVEDIISRLRRLGIESLNFDLIYGLPEQTGETIKATILEVVKMRPDTIAFYSYAHVPWKSKAQKTLEKYHIPAGDEKRSLYQLGKGLLEESGYKEIGMDHFALEEDILFKAFKKGKLKRNFMGYTARKGDCILGLGASSISDSGKCFIQNEKDPLLYCKLVEKDKLPIVHGHVLDEIELKIAKNIQEIMCSGETDISEILKLFDNEKKEQVEDEYLNMKKDGLIELEAGILKVTGMGNVFVRNICMVLDIHLKEKSKNCFSKTV